MAAKGMRPQVGFVGQFRRKIHNLIFSSASPGVAEKSMVRVITAFSMVMGVMRVGSMRVRMQLSRMSMRMAVWISWHGLMYMVVMPVIMRVSVLVLHLFVLVLVMMRLGKMDHHADEHQRASKHQTPNPNLRSDHPDPKPAQHQ